MFSSALVIELVSVCLFVLLFVIEDSPKTTKPIF